MKSARSASWTTASTTGRRYARSIEPQSVMGTPTASDARRLTVADNAAAQERVDAPVAPCADDVVAGVDLREQPRDLLGRVLEIGVDRDDDVAARVGEAGEDGGMLPDVPGERDDRHARVARRDLREDRRAIDRGCRRRRRPPRRSGRGRSQTAERRASKRASPADSLNTGTTIETAGASASAAVTIPSGSAVSGRMATEHVGEGVDHVAHVVFDHRGKERQRQDRRAMPRSRAGARRARRARDTADGGGAP